MREAEVWKFVDGDDITCLRPNGRFIADNALSLVAATLEGVGLAYLPEPLVADHIASGALVAVMNRYPVPPAGIFVVRAPSPYPSEKVKRLTEMFAECFDRPHHDEQPLVESGAY